MLNFKFLSPSVSAKSQFRKFLLMHSLGVVLLTCKGTGAINLQRLILNVFRTPFLHFRHFCISIFLESVLREHLYLKNNNYAKCQIFRPFSNLEISFSDFFYFATPWSLCHWYKIWPMLEQVLPPVFFYHYFLNRFGRFIIPYQQTSI